MTILADPRPRRLSPRETVEQILAKRITDPMELHETVREIDEALTLPTTWTAPGVRSTAGNP